MWAFFAFVFFSALVVLVWKTTCNRHKAQRVSEINFHQKLLTQQQQQQRHNTTTLNREKGCCFNNKPPRVNETQLREITYLCPCVFNSVVGGGEGGVKYRVECSTKKEIWGIKKFEV